MKCRICQNETSLSHVLKVRQKHDAEYFFCNKCRFMFVGNPYWLKEAYEQPINTTDTGYVLRNVYLSRKTLLLFFFLFGKNKLYLDYGGGYGILTRLMRDYGLNFFWQDHYTQNLFASGFEYKEQKIEAVSCFECFEHLPDPLIEIEKMFLITKNIFFSTVLLPDEIPPPHNWEYYGVNHGQHVAFYSKRTLEYIAEKYCLHLYSDNANLHLLTEHKISKWLFNFLLFLTKPQLDLVVRKCLKSKTITDHFDLKKQGYM